MGSEQPKKSEKKELMGRLKSMGLTLPYQIPLLLPDGWDDLRNPVDRFGSVLPAAPSCAITGRLKNAPSVRFDGAAPRLVGYLYDDRDNRIGFMAFGDTRAFQEALQSQPDRVTLIGQLDVFNDQNWIKSPEIVPENWLGRLRPRYRGKTGVITPENVRERVLARLAEAIPLTVEFLLRKLAQFGDRNHLAQLSGIMGVDLEAILYQAHLPRTVQIGEAAQEALQRLAALGTIATATAGKPERRCTTTLDLPDWRERAKAIPFPLTDEQEQAISDALAEMRSGHAMHRVISGDVGTGKTAVFALVATTVVDAGGTVACLLPNQGLAMQVFEEISGWWPDLPVQLLTGSHKEELCGSMVVGTSALLFEELGDLDLVIVDELQKSSRAQREHLVGPNTHLIEATATCIPRSQALIRYGAVKVSRLTKTHTPKEIHTRIWSRDEWPALFAAVKDTLSKGDQVLMVYPLREKAEEQDPEPGKDAPPRQKKQELTSAAEVFAKWEAMFPGQVRLLHGEKKDEMKEVLDDMRAGRASILCATTVVEVGITIPKLRRVVVVHPERHGASTLHQIRGRLCRNGGVGHFDMFLPRPVKAATQERLQVLVRTTDGFEVAELDMMNRGIGDLSANSDRQSGADMTFLFGKPVSIPILDEMIKRVNNL